MAWPSCAHMVTRTARRALASGPPPRPPNVYRPGQVIRLNRVWKKRADDATTHAERELAVQAAIATSLAVLFVGLPYSYAMLVENRSVRIELDGDASRRKLQQAVYDRRLENRAALAASLEDEEHAAPPQRDDPSTSTRSSE
eukprot:CAMPEP_0185703720 /NCGR_PEP_ID=MMETSP1164-20130828/15335_1 /TAXON_ID=1104430 /ORGANISM="Chrysoreinhardia sp, Strain CCMP2950" /LENGTH=141 /DNA_ID=CAMNT_0028371027 /DNA_START=28 /DNA_END=453 /DNA_ORIENTATION=+